MRILDIPLFVLVFGTLTIGATPAFAYLDPGTGTLLLQALIGGIAVGLGALKLYWYKVKKFFVKDKKAIKE